MLPSAPSQFASQYFEVVPILGAHCIERLGALAYLDLVAGHQGDSGLSVRGQHYLLLSGIHLEAYLDVER